ncbi:hypothetical protein [Aliiroseovarius sp. F20344]|uniref:hypothetical protein n=1 Tax=Aliiroseovarius sp. F20344 TaxID=2926414 RepID=UPI001FF3FD59|nr:hypothetical protein [Aliiroseovarius sp. F20344]MCK0143039.1 hypothetical protein [Aliiroseovarius sp. F20344]
MSHISRRFALFISEEEGAITVDWVVLTAIVAGVGSVSAWLVTSNIPGFAQNIGDAISVMSVGP